MTAKPFFLLVIAALLLGGGLGAILIVALPLEHDDNIPVSPPLAPQSGFPQTGARLGSAGIDAPNLVGLGELARRVESGDVSPEEALQLQRRVMQMAQGAGGALGPGGVGPPGGEGFGSLLPGVIESLEENVLTLDTPIGLLQADVGDDTSITVLSEEEGTTDDLAPGLQVTLEVAPNEDGSLEASSVTVLPELPEGAALLIEGGLVRHGRLPGGQGGLGGPPTGERPNAGAGGLFAGAAMAGGLTGVIESLKGGVLAVNTPIGPLQVTVGDDVAVATITETQGTPDDLTVGLLIMISVEPNEDGSVEAASVIVFPESVSLPMGGGLGRPGAFGDGQRGPEAGDGP